MELAWTVEHGDGVTLVSLRVDNDGRERRVDVRNSLDGPVWAPRRNGQPAAGWSREGFEGVVPENGTLPLGYACPAPAREPPAEIVDVGPVEELREPTAADAVRRLGDPRPPRDAVSGPDCGRAPPEGFGAPAGDR